MEASPSPSQDKGLGVLVLLPRCPLFALPSVMALQVDPLCRSRDCSWAGQFVMQENSPFGRQGLPSSHARTPTWRSTGVRDLPDISVLHLEGSQRSGPSILGVPGSRVRLQTCPNRLLMGCLQAGPRQPDRQQCAWESTHESAARVHS